MNERPEVFDNIGASIGESGGHAIPLTAVDGSIVNLYPVAVAERGTLHMRLRAKGTSGHGSRPTRDSAVRKLIAATQRIESYEWPMEIGETVREYIEGANRALGHDVDLDSEEGVHLAIDRMGEAGIVARVTIRCSATTTVLRAGYKVNVIPGIAEAEVDVRCLPGTFEATKRTIEELVGPEVEATPIDPGPPTNFSSSSPWFASMKQAIHHHDPEGVVLPYCMGGGTDSKAFARLGMECFGFVPLTPDPDGRTTAGVHGVDERVPVSSVNGGQKLLSDFLVHV